LTRPTILIVEDTPYLAQVIRRELEAEGYAILHAEDGLSALEMHDHFNPDLVILDWMLPKLDGLEVLRQIRSKSPTLVLMLTARDAEIDRVLGLEIGADDYLTKPFSMRELIARTHAILRRLAHVQQILSSDRVRQTDPLIYEALHLNPATFSVTLAGRPIDLTRTEFDILTLLLRNPGRVFSRAYLLDTIWGETFIPGDRSVDNAILRLRKKIEDLGENIETVWGVGYRLKAKP
jgi:DNA-binding response OmpR family regulator